MATTRQDVKSVTRGCEYFLARMTDGCVGGGEGDRLKYLPYPNQGHHTTQVFPNGLPNRLSTGLGFLMTLLCRFFYLLSFYKEIFFFFVYVIQHCFICRPTVSTLLEEDGIVKPMNFATKALAARRSNKSARSHPLDLLSGLPNCCILAVPLSYIPDLQTTVLN